MTTPHSTNLIKDRPSGPMPEEPKAQYPHNCESCRFLFGAGFTDVYWCLENGDGDGGSIIARFGRDPKAYASAPVLIALGFRPETPTISAMRDGAADLVRRGLIRAVPTAQEGD